MIENKKPEIVEEEENQVESSKRFIKTGFIVIGTILALMVLCIIGIVIFENI